MSFAAFFLSGHKRQKRDDEEEEHLTPIERSIYADLSLRFRDDSRARDIIHKTAPKGIDDPNARQVVVCLQEMWIKENLIDKSRFESVSQQLALSDTENRGLKRANEQLQAANERMGPIQKILDDSKALQEMIFRQAATEKELRETIRQLEQRLVQANTHWSEYYKGEKDAMRKHATQNLEELHWDFLDKVVNDVPNNELRDCIISFMEKSRLILNNI